MPYDEHLADRVRQKLARHEGLEEKKMFGGVGFLLRGNMCVGVWREYLIARIGTAGYDAALREPNTKQFDITGRPMKGWVMVEADGLADGVVLRTWIERAVRFVKSLPPK